MTHENLIAIKEKINELRAKQRGHAIKEINKAYEIKDHIEKQADIEDSIMEWEIHLAKMQKQLQDQKVTNCLFCGCELKENQVEYCDARCKLGGCATWI